MAGHAAHVKLGRMMLPAGHAQVPFKGSKTSPVPKQLQLVEFATLRPNCMAEQVTHCVVDALPIMTIVCALEHPQVLAALFHINLPTHTQTVRSAEAPIMYIEGVQVMHLAAEPLPKTIVFG